MKKIELADSYGKSKTRAIGVIIDKEEDLPDGWCEQGGAYNQVGLLIETIKLIASSIPEETILVYIDRHDAYEVPELAEYIKIQIEELSKQIGKTIEYEFVKSSSGEMKDQMQTNDIVPHSILLKYERDDPSVSNALHLVDFKLGNKSNIKVSIKHKRPKE